MNKALCYMLGKQTSFPKQTREMYKSVCNEESSDNKEYLTLSESLIVRAWMAFPRWTKAWWQHLEGVLMLEMECLLLPFTLLFSWKRITSVHHFDLSLDYVSEWVEWVKLLSRVWLFVTPWIVAYQAPPSMMFSRQEYWSGLPFPSPGDLPNPGIEPRSPAL